LLTLSLLPGAFSGSVTALLYARERMSPPAAIGIATSLLNVSLGVGALLLGWGVIGLALSALVATLVTAIAFALILRRDFPEIVLKTAGRIKPDQNRAWRRFPPLLKAGWPLMLNALLVGLFFRADQFIIKANQDDLAVERYAAAYSFLNFVLLITPAVTLALFPRMARHAETDKARLAYEYTFALKMLLMLSVPLMALTIWFAPILITIVTGGRPEFQPSSVVVLQILILFLPLSFINGVTQYVLIALNRQNLITWAFGATVLFNLAANMVLVPLLGINGAAIATIGSELVLLVPFLYWTSKEIGPVHIDQLAWKTLLAGAMVAAVAWLLWPFQDKWRAGSGEFASYLGIGLLLLVSYVLTVTLLKPLTQQELSGLRSALGRRASKKQ
ncbi:MAG: flippase, partial [Chloroflexia bacterium]